MDWLRSEDLKEEKVLTTSKHTIARQEAICSFQIDLAGTEFEADPRSSHPEGLESPRIRAAPAIACQPQVQFPPAQHDLPQEGPRSLLIFLSGNQAAGIDPGEFDDLSQSITHRD